MEITDVYLKRHFSGGVTVVRRIALLIAQVFFLMILSEIGNLIAVFFHLPIPGSVIGLFLLLFLLYKKWVRVEWFEFGASLLLSEMLLFFVPSAAGIVQYGALMSVEGWRLLLVIAVSTLLVMGATGWVADRLHHTLAKEKTTHAVD